MKDGRRKTKEAKLGLPSSVLRHVSCMTTPSTLIQNRYRIDRLLGTGGFARVYLAQDERLGRRVAVKEMSAARLDDLEQHHALALFEGEARMLAQLDHPNLTNIWDFFQHDERAYLVMEYIPGLTLRDLVLQHGGPLPEPLTLACGIQLCTVLGYLHSRTPPVIFRDLKPGNVIVEDLADGMALTAANLTPENLTLKLIDFGIARLFKPEQSADTMVIGTPGYASPEGYGQGQTDQRSDVYSLGATLHHLASGQPPNGLILPPLLDLNPQASPALARIITRATALKPGERYQDVASMRRDLQALAGGATRTAPPPPAPRPTVPLAPQQPRPTVPLAPQPRPARATGPSPLLLMMIALVVLGAVVLGGFALRGFGQDGETGSVAAPTAVSEAPAASTALLPGATGQLLFSQCVGGVQACNIYLTDVAEQLRPQLMSGGAINTSSDISPDGRRITVTRNNTVYFGPLVDPTEQQIETPARYAVFSPDGKSLAYIANPTGDAQLATIDLASRQVTYIEPNFAQYGWVTWAEQGLAYAAAEQAGGVQDIFVVSDGGSRNLTNTPDAEEEFPSWSPDGQMVFTASAPGDLGTRQIVRVDADGGNRAQLTTTTGPHTNPAYSPDGNWIAYVSRAGSNRFQLWAMRTDGSEPHQLLQSDEIQFFVRWK